jgi:hypothetical protein
MNATNPITIDGKTYDRFSLNLAITGKYKPDQTSDAQIAMRLIPTRIADGAVETADAEAIGISLGTLAGSDQATQTAVSAIQAALQTYLQAKGL